MNQNIEHRVEGEYFSYDGLKRALIRLEEEGFVRSELLIATKENHPKLDEIHSLSFVEVHAITELPEKPSFFEKIVDAITINDSELDAESHTLLDFGIDVETARRFNEGLKNNSALILIDTKAPRHIKNDHVSYVNQQIFDKSE